MAYTEGEVAPQQPKNKGELAPFTESNIFGLDSFFRDFTTAFPEFNSIFSNMLRMFESFQREFEQAQHDPNAEVHTIDKDLPGGGHIQGWSITRRWGSIPSEPQVPLLPKAPGSEEAIPVQHPLKRRQNPRQPASEPFFTPLQHARPQFV